MVGLFRSPILTTGADRQILQAGLKAVLATAPGQRLPKPNLDATGRPKPDTAKPKA